MNLRGGYAFTPDARLGLSIENLFDENYRIHGSGVNEAGLNVILVMEVDF